MAILGISAAARAAGVNRSTLQRAIKTGRLSATIDAAGERGIDLAELLRVFGPLRQMPQEDRQRMRDEMRGHGASPHGGGGGRGGRR